MLPQLAYSMLTEYPEKTRSNCQFAGNLVPGKHYLTSPYPDLLCQMRLRWDFGSNVPFDKYYMLFDIMTVSHIEKGFLEK